MRNVNYGGEETLGGMEGSRTKIKVRKPCIKEKSRMSFENAISFILRSPWHYFSNNRHISVK